MNCNMRGRWDRVNQAIRQALAGITVADVTAPPRVMLATSEPTLPLTAA